LIHSGLQAKSADGGAVGKQLPTFTHDNPIPDPGPFLTPEPIMLTRDTMTKELWDKLATAEEKEEKQSLVDTGPLVLRVCQRVNAAEKQR
jgi:hypothetical protein